MSLSTPFIRRPVGTTLLTIAIALAGGIAYFFLPVSPLPQVDYPTISVSAQLPGASPETMASSVATPLERQFGRIAGVTEMSSSSTLGSTSITMQFELTRDIDAAARDVQAAINGARGQLPSNLPSNPSYRKVNPSDAPIMILAITSTVYDKAHMYDAASSILAQKLSQVAGVGQVFVGGGALPAVRVEVNPTSLNSYGLGLENVRTVLGAANVNTPKGEISSGPQNISLATTDQLRYAAQYRPLIIAYRNGAPVRISDIAQVNDSVQDSRTFGMSDLKPAVLLFVFRQPNANIIDTVNRIKDMIPQFRAEIPAAMTLSIGMDRTTTIRASVTDVEFTLVLSICLVIMVVFVFLRSGRSTLVPAVAVPVSLIGTFGVMYLCGYSIDNLSLMAMTIATGFVVDDAIVVSENITRHLEQGMEPVAAALLGAKEIGFTVLSMSISLVAVFIPILLMGGYVGRLFQEFAVVLSVAIGISLVVSLTTTPMMCAVLFKTRDKNHEEHGRLYQWSENGFNWVLHQYEMSLSWVLRHSFLMILVTLGTIAFTVFLYLEIPKGFFPQQDTGRLQGQITADQDTSAQAMTTLMTEFGKAVGEDPDVESVLVSGGGGRGTLNQGSMYATLKPLGVRKLDVDHVMARLRTKLSHITGGTLYLQAVQDLKTGGRSSAAQYQYTLQGDVVEDVNQWAPKLQESMSHLRGLVDVNSNQQNNGMEAELVIDRDTAQRLGISIQMIDDTLYDAFGQREVSTMYTPLNQYFVVMEVAPQFWQNPDGLKYIYLTGTNGVQVPLSEIAHYAPSNTALAVNHTGPFPSATISFNLLPGVALGDAETEIQSAENDMGMPGSMHGSFSGTAQAFSDTLSSELVLIIAALVAVYIVLGILYESFIHPVTILSTLPSAGVGALVALMVTNTQLTVIAIIGIILLIGIVKKNAIMMIDFAVSAERNEGKKPEEAIFQACLLRFRPIMMTTMAALLGGLPLAIGAGTGAELRRPLGISIVGGLIFSQVLTLYTTPVVYLYLDRFRLWARGPQQPVAPLPAMELGHP